MNNLPWLFPLLEAVHITGIAMLFGGLLVFELRMLGWGQVLSAVALAKLTLTPALLGFGLCAVTGLTMFSTQAQELLANPAFKWKLLLICLAGGNAAFFHARSGISAPDVLAKAQCVVSLGLWLAVIICGRWIAYA